MKSAKIFLVGDEEGKLRPMVETAYITEDMLQTLLARYPDLLPGDQIDPEDPCRWLLVAREMAVPGDETETGRWSLDHLFLDQDGIPTFVECKRASDTRARREVVAQMLDYAANGIEYWSMDRLRQAAAQTHGDSLGDKIKALIETEDDSEVENYWKQVEANLRQGQVRLIFVADDLPKELRRLVEFLNEQMSDVQVLAVEVKQFVGEGQKALVPRVIGATESALEKKGTRSGPKHFTNRDEFLSKCEFEVRPFFERVLDLAKARGHTINWGEVGFSVRGGPPLRAPGSFAYGYPPGSGPSRFSFRFDFLPLSDDESGSLRQQLLALGVFEEGGNYFLNARLEGEILGQMDQVYDFILDKIDEIMKA